MTRSTGALPTHEDAKLLLELYEMRREPRLRDARRWFAASFRAKTVEELMALCPPGSEENASYRMVTSYWELVASFVTSGVLNQELFFQSGRELLLVWERVRDLVPSMRETYKDPNYLKNLETVGTEFAAYMKGQSAPAYEAFLKRIK